MNKLQEVEFYNGILDAYSELLSKTQKDILIDYFELNLCLQEISENRNITRSAVLDALKKGKAKLLEFEKTLHIFEKTTLEIDLIEKYKADKNPKTLDKLERIIKDGI